MIKKRVAIIGIRGVPANYGGFETLVENMIGSNASDDIEYTIFCSARAYPKRRKTYKGAKLRYIGLNANGIQSIAYDILAMVRTSRKYDAALILGTSGCIFLPIFRLYFHNKIIVNIDGLEHRRGKWGRAAKWFLRTSEKIAVKNADVIIADNKGIRDYVSKTYHHNAALIAYGGDHVERIVSDDVQKNILQRYGVENSQYAISICRIEPENNIQMILEAFAQTSMKLVFIGNWERNSYGKELKEEYSKYKNIIISNSEYCLDTLYTLRSHATMYIHGHSAGGTNPSLVEAMFFGRPILAFDVVYNRATTDNKAYYFRKCDELRALICQEHLNGSAMKGIAHLRYTWKNIASQYEELF